MKEPVNKARSRPRVWHVAAAYQIPGGIEAHVLHYATEMRNHGFDTRVVVFKPLPPAPHRFLDALRERGISIDSLDDLAARRERAIRAALFVPWFLYTILVKRKRPQRRSFRLWAHNRASLHELDRLLAAEWPDVIHIFGRQRTEAWKRFPADRTIFHEMMTGTVDQHWTPAELEDFRSFAESVARYFAPGEGVAANVKREFGIQRRIDAIYTMCPDEGGGGGGRWEVAGGRWQGAGSRGQGAGSREQGAVNSEQSGAGRLDDRLKEVEHRTSNIERRTSNEAPALPLRSSKSPPQADPPAVGNVECATFGFTDQEPQILPPTTCHLPPLLRFGILCRFTGQKGIRYLLGALKLYRDRHGDVDFTFAGSGPMEKQIREFAASNGLSNVRVMSVPSAAAVLKDIDVFVHPSVDDAMPMAIAEALMCGIPCIVCRVGGCADLVRDGQEGFVIEPRQTEAIQARMERFAAMRPDEHLGFCRRARRRYEEVCQPVQVGAVVAKHYREILAAL